MSLKLGLTDTEVTAEGWDGDSGLGEGHWD